MKNKVIWGVAGLEGGGSPGDRDLRHAEAGSRALRAIGQAQRYQAPQISNKDVEMAGSAEAQQFLQSDAFDRLMKDPAARSALLIMVNNPALLTIFDHTATFNTLDPHVVPTLTPTMTPSLVSTHTLTVVGVATRVTPRRWCRR